MVAATFKLCKGRQSIIYKRRLKPAATNSTKTLSLMDEEDITKLKEER